MRRLVGRAGLIAILLFVPPPVHAQDRVRESVAVDVDLTVQRQLDLARVQLDARQWKDAFDLIRRSTQADLSPLVRVAPGRYLSARSYAQLMFVGLSGEGLAAYRQWMGSDVDRRLSEGVGNRDAAALRDIVVNAFATQAGETAMLTLGQWAWESGRVEEARTWWQRLIAPRGTFTLGACPVLRYPDASISRADLLARLVMCSLAEGDIERAERERAALRAIAPEARGTLGGRTGPLEQLLAAAADEAKSWRIPPRDRATATFGVNAARNGVLPPRGATGGVRWSAAIEANRWAPDLDTQLLNLFPVSHGRHVFVASDDRIDVWNAETGKPAWPSRRDDSATVYPSVLTPRLGLTPTRLYGGPVYSLTIADGRLYARMGSPITVRSRRDPQLTDSHLVCLDVAEGEGRLVWKVEASALDPPAVFEGTPVVVGDRAYAVVRQARPQAQTDVICLDAGTGEPRWRRKVCALASILRENANLMTHQLLTSGDDAVFLATGAGAVAAVETDRGGIRWIAAYEGRPWRDRPLAEWGSAPPALYSEGRVFAGGGDLPGVAAFDSRTGATLWSREPRGGVQHLIGVAGGALIVSGKLLHGYDAATGRRLWTVGFEDPLGWGYGRGLLAGDVLWPLREELLVVDPQSGEMRQRIPLSTVHGESGGNLSLVEGNLLIAQPNRIVLFGSNGLRSPSPARPLISALVE